MLDGKIRNLSLCVIKRGVDILVGQGFDDVKQQEFFRPLGGGIEFGEYSQDALQREFMEELNTQLKNIKFLTTIENLFTFNGQSGHEITLIYQADLVNKELYEQDGISILDSKRGLKAFWKPIDDFKTGKLIIYPEGIIQLF